MKYYIYLAISILGEVFGTTMLKISDGFTVLLPSAGVVAGYGLSYFCLSLCLKVIPLSLAYAIWAGLGTVLTAIIGFIVWGEVFTFFKISGVILVIGGILLLNMSENSDTAKNSS
ncbi:DMT family transporter [Halobacillus campisalis]|uniref:DMT family transporter n=1 Tax=Halobacillus campisalis TaxID=435909 RepID=A0ABW2K0B1_9BACI|nr:multidrug efflux SMR transporter [Halobacillus campisalis]